MSKGIFLDGSRFIPSSTAASTAGVSRDYIGRLCREGKINGKQVGKQWFVEEQSLHTYLAEVAVQKEKRREEIREERLREYDNGGDEKSYGQETIAATTAESDYGAAPEVKNEKITTARRRKELKKIIDRGAARLDHAVTPAAKVPTHSSPLVAHTVSDLGQRAAALMLALALTFGTYGVVDGDYARFAYESAGETVALARNVPTALAQTPRYVSGAAHQFAAATQSAAANPTTFFSALKQRGAQLARQVNASIDGITYRFVEDFRDNTDGSVAVQVSSGRRNTQTAQEDSTEQADSQNTNGTRPATVVNQPVVERVVYRERVEPVETQRVVTQSGVTEDLLTQRLEELNNKLTAKITDLTAVNSQEIVNNYKVISQTNKIDNLEDVTIKNSTVTGGSVTATSFDGTLGVSSGGTGLSSKPSFGQLLRGNASSGYSLVATSTLGIALSDTTGTLAVSRGGTGTTTAPTAGDLLVADSSGVYGPWELIAGDNVVIATSSPATATRGSVTISSLGANTWQIDGNGNLAPTTTIAVQLPSTLYASSSALFDSFVSADYFTATSTTATSTFAGALTVQTNALVVQDNTGNVGIGTTDPSTALDVQGTASSTNIRVDTLTAGLPVAADSSKNLTSTSTLRDFVIADALTLSTGSTINDTPIGASTASTGVFTTATTTSATTTNFAISSLASALLSTDQSGTVVATSSLQDAYIADDITLTNLTQITNRNAKDLQNFGDPFFTFFNATTTDALSEGTTNLYQDHTFPFDLATQFGASAVSTSTLTGFTGGFVSTASSTASGGLTISVATTTSATTTNFAISSLANALLATDDSGTLLSTSTIGVNLIPDNFLRNDQDDTTTGSVTATEFVANDAAATSTFAGGLTVQTNALVVQDDSGNVGLGTTSPHVSFAVDATDGILIPVGTDAQRPSGSAALTGLLRYNTSNSSFEGYDGANWSGLGGVIDVDQDTQIHAEKNTDEDKLRFDTAGTERMIISESGLIGIGTSTPYSKLTIWGDATGNTFEVVDSASTTDFAITAGGNVNIAALSASRLVASDASKNLVSTITETNLESSISDVTDIFTNNDGILQDHTFPFDLATQFGASAVSTSTLTGFTGGFVSTASSTITDLTLTNATATNATTTNLGVSSLTAGTLIQSDAQKQLTSITTGASSTVLTTDGTDFSFQNLVFSAIDGLVNLANQVTGILQVANGGTGWGEFQANSLILGNGTNQLATTTAGTDGQVLALVSGVPTWAATTTFSSGLTYLNGNVTADLGTNIEDAEVDNDITLTNLTQITNRNAKDLQNFGDPFFTFFNATTTDALSEGTTNLYQDHTFPFDLATQFGASAVSTSTIVGFTNGLLSTASTTIGAGGQATGLTISGGATTTGDLIVSGGDITLGATSIFSGGDTASLNNIDAIDATTETTFESALDTFFNDLTVSNTAPNFSLDDSDSGQNATFRVSFADVGSILRADFSPTTDSAESAEINFFRNTDTAGDKSVLFNAGDGTTVTHAQIGVSGLDSYFQVGGGGLGVGTSTPYSKLSVWGASTGNIFEAVTSASTSALTISGTGNATTTVTGLNINGSATSTSNVGMNITTGCFSVNGTCVGGGSGGVGSGTQGQLPFYDAAGTNLTATSTLTLTQSGLFGIGTSTPYSKLTVWGDATAGTFFEVVNNASTTIFSAAGDSLGGSIFNTARATTTVPNNEAYAWTIATSTTGSPLFKIDTTSNSAVNIGQAGTDVIIGDVGNGADLVFEENSSIRGQGSGRTLSFGANSDVLQFGISSLANCDAITTDGSGTISCGGSGLFTDGGDTTYLADTNDLLAIGTSTAYSRLTVWATSTLPYFQAVDSASTTQFIIDNSGSVGVGTSTPWRKLSITDTVSNAQLAVAYDATRYTQFQTDSAGDLIIDPQGDDVFLNDDNLFVCTGGACPSGTPSGTGNLVVETALGVASSSPSAVLEVQGDVRFGEGDNYNGFFFDATNAKLGVGTSSPAEQLGIANNIFVGGGGSPTLGTATSTFEGDITILGKLDVSTIDPVYTIDGTKYATYGHSTIGVKEEAAVKVAVDEYDRAKRAYKHVIDFDELQEGSDLWLFYQVTDFGTRWENLVVTLTPAFDGDVYYEEDNATNTITIYSDKKGNVSARLIANRFDSTRWPNLRPDQDSGHPGHVIEEKR